MEHVTETVQGPVYDLYSLINPMAVDDILTQEGMTSAAVILTKFCWNISVSAPVGCLKMSSYQYRDSLCGIYLYIIHMIRRLSLD